VSSHFIIGGSLKRNSSRLCIGCSCKYKNCGKVLLPCERGTRMARHA
jgi:hypothetical protein